jgi:hypothetical protein
MPDVYQNIQDGKYKNPVPYPSKPKTPDLLGKTASMLTNAQIASIPTVKAEHEAAMKKWETDRAAYDAAERERLTRFEEDCAKACGLENHPKRGALYGLAWDHGHASGLSDVWHYYEELSSLLK